MPEPELCLLFVRPLNRLGVRYVVSGSVAAMVYGEPVSVAPPEYVIVRKLEYYREGGSEKHLRDVRAMIAVSKAQLNRSELEDWIARRGLGTEWRAATA